jgi:hypothetical protein
VGQDNTGSGSNATGDDGKSGIWADLMRFAGANKNGLRASAVLVSILGFFYRMHDDGMKRLEEKMDQLEGKLEGKMESSRLEMKADIKEIKSELKAQVESLTEKVDEVRKDLQSLKEVVIARLASTTGVDTSKLLRPTK